MAGRRRVRARLALRARDGVSGPAPRRERSARARSVARDRATDLSRRGLGNPSERFRRLLRGAVCILRDRRRLARARRGGRGAGRAACGGRRHGRGIELRLSPTRCPLRPRARAAAGSALAALERRSSEARPRDVHERAVRARRDPRAGAVRRERRAERSRGSARSRHPRRGSGVACYSRRSPGALRARTTGGVAEVSLPTARAFFRDRFGLDDRNLAAALDAALERRIDYADLFFEYSTQDSVVLEEGIVKTGDRHLEQGVGVRAQVGERQGYAHSDELSAEALQIAARTARSISADAGAGSRAAVVPRSGARDLYPVAQPPTDATVASRIALVEAIDPDGASRGPRIVEVMASCVTQHCSVLVMGSDGTLAEDARPLVRLNVQVIARAGDRREVGYQGCGGRSGFEALEDPERWRALVEEAVRTALLNLEAEPCPAGSMTVVLGPGWPGVLLHEAVGHGLEGDFNRKRTSAFAGRLGERVAAPGVTVVDDGTLPGRRGSLNVDDEGTPTQRTVLIEDGILRGYLQDRLNARLMSMEPTGNGRRESYAHLPMPRMTNTFMLAGEENPEEILRSVRRGLYAVSFGGGQVDITSGKFVFTANEAYRIEDGRLGAPVKGATLIGNGPDALLRVSRIGRDLALDRGVGTCGKDGQGVTGAIVLPAVRIAGLTVGGTEG